MSLLPLLCAFLSKLSSALNGIAYRIKIVATFFGAGQMNGRGQFSCFSLRSAVSNAIFMHSFIPACCWAQKIYIYKKIKNTELAREKQAKFSIKRIHIIFMSLVQCDNKNFPLSISLTPRSSCTLFYDNELNFVDSLDNSLLPLLLLHPFLWRRLRRRRLH